MSADGTSVTVRHSRWLMVACCCAIMTLEGFDLLIYSNAIPALLADRGMQIDHALAGRIGSAIFVSMLLGGVVAGRVTQALGLQRTIVWGIGGFTLATGLVMWVQTGWQLGALRFLAGLGLGVVLPSGLSLARQHVRREHGALAISMVMAGIAVGGMLASVAARIIIPGWGWRALFLCGGVLGLALLLLMLPGLARVQARSMPVQAAAAGVPAASWRDILHGASARVLCLGVIATMACLLTWYGVAVWLTQLMREFDMPFDGAVQMMFTLSMGAVLGSIFTGGLAMRLGTRRVAIAAGWTSALCLLAIVSRRFDGAPLFAVVAILGMSAISAQNLVNALVADAFPDAYRAAAMGITLGVGRLGAVIAPALGGYILAAGHGPGAVLQAFALSAVVGALALLPFTRSLSARSLARLQPGTAQDRLHTTAVEQALARQTPG